jgi:hypothetical protein
MQRTEIERKGPVLTALPTDNINAVIVPFLSIFQQCLRMHTPPPPTWARMRGDICVFFGNAMDVDRGTKLDWHES